MNTMTCKIVKHKQTYGAVSQDMFKTDCRDGPVRAALVVSRSPNSLLILKDVGGKV